MSYYGVTRPQWVKYDKYEIKTLSDCWNELKANPQAQTGFYFLTFRKYEILYAGSVCHKHSLGNVWKMISAIVANFHFQFFKVNVLTVDLFENIDIILNYFTESCSNLLSSLVLWIGIPNSFDTFQIIMARKPNCCPYDIYLDLQVLNAELFEKI